MNVTPDVLPAMRDRQRGLAAELQAARDDPSGSPSLCVPARIAGAAGRGADAFIGLGPDGPPPGPAVRLGFARPRPVRRDADAVGLLHHVLEWASGGAGERSRRAAARLRAFAELKIGQLSRARPGRRDDRSGPSL